jgi:hypothetical protein
LAGTVATVPAQSISEPTGGAASLTAGPPDAAISTSIASVVPSSVTVIVTPDLRRS